MSFWKMMLDKLQKEIDVVGNGAKNNHVRK